MTFAERLRSGGTILLDGGLGTALIARGLPIGAPPETWNTQRPEAVTAIHRHYVEAGSEAVHTNTFGANPARLAAFGLERDCGMLNRAAVACARAAGARFVIGDVGPSGEYLPPVGSGDPARWRDAFEAQAAALVDAGADALHVETMSDLREARVALEALLARADGIPVLVSMTFERRKRGFFTVMGNPLAEALRTLCAGGAAAVGANCSITSADMAALAAEALAAANAPVVLQPNAGSPQPSEQGPPRYEQPPSEFAEQMAAVARLGVQLVGGCCGTDARFIAALAGLLGRETTP